jgi:hypothetical protein
VAEATGRVTSERVAVVAKGQERLERVVVVMVAEVPGRAIRGREEAEVTGQAKAEATREVGPLR